MPKLKSVCRWFWNPTVLLLAVSSGFAVDYDRVDRTILKEPTYKSGAPQYALLLFGSSAKRVWLVIDGNTAYVDRNSNGDLTDPRERFDKATDGSRQLFIEIPDPDGKSSCVIANLQVDSNRDGLNANRVFVNVLVFGAVHFKQYCFIELAGSPQHAIPAHFNGPLTIVPAIVEGKPDPSLRLLAGNSTNLRAIVGTTRPNGQPVVVDSCEDGVHEEFPCYAPVADIEFPAKSEGQAAIRQRYLLDQSCCGSIFKGEVLAPSEAGPGKAKVTLSFDMWKEGHVTHSTAEIPVITAKQAKQETDDAAKSSAERSNRKADVK